MTINKMENIWAKALKEGKEVKVSIAPNYTGNNRRPDSFNVNYSINKGRPVEELFMNAPRGK